MSFDAERMAGLRSYAHAAKKFGSKVTMDAQTLLDLIGALDLAEVELRESWEARESLRPGNLAETLTDAQRIGMADGWDEAVAKSASLLWGREKRHKSDQDLSAEIGAALHEIRREGNPYR